MTLKYDFKESALPTLLGRPLEINGFEQFKQRVEKLIRTAKGRSTIYERSGYGLNFYNRINETKNADILRADLASELCEKLIDGTEVFAVRDVTLEMKNHKGEAKFTLDTVYGTETEVIKW